MKYSFEDLEVWQRSVKFAIDVVKLIESLPEKGMTPFPMYNKVLSTTQFYGKNKQIDFTGRGEDSGYSRTNFKQNKILAR